MALSQKQIEKARDSLKHIFVSSGHKDIDSLWDAWLAMNESLSIEIPARQKHIKSDSDAMTNMKSGFNSCLTEIELILDKSGIPYKNKG